jgi:hypothetical protein
MLSSPASTELSLSILGAHRVAANRAWQGRAEEGRGRGAGQGSNRKVPMGGQRAAGGTVVCAESDVGRRYGRGHGWMWLVAVLETYVKRRAHGGLGLLRSQNSVFHI